MARVIKTILTEGTHQSPDGPVVATKARMQRMADLHTSMRKNGIKFPLSWGHQSKAWPGYDDDADTKAFFESRYNAGYVDRLFMSRDGTLKAAIEAPGLDVDKSGNLVTYAELPNGTRVPTAISEVSAAITEKFRDGKGKVWEDVITHVALTPLPVVAGQDGFTQLATARPESKLVRLSLGSQQWRLAGKPEEDDMADAPPPPPDDQDDIETESGATDGDSKFAECMKLLADHGIKLPDDTTEEDLMSHLCVALTALQGQLTPKGEGGEGGYSGSPTVEEQPTQMMMSLERDPVRKKLFEQAETRFRDDQAKKINRLLRHGMPPHIVADLQSASNVIRLGLTANGDTREPKNYTQTQVLDLLERILLVTPSGKKLLKRLSTAHAITDPLAANGPENKAIVDHYAKAAGVK